MIVFCLEVTSTSNRVTRIGNPIRSSTSGMNVPGAVFLINDIVLREGVLYAYRSYFRSDKPVHFQVWRPEGEETPTGRDFKLISDVRIVPSVVDQVEDIYLSAKFLDCVVVQENDRLGLFFEESPGAVAYTFDGDDPRVYGATQDPNNSSQVSETIHFDSLIFPYDFSVAAYVDTELSSYNSTFQDFTVECPDNLLIPDVDIVADLTPAPPVTGAPGATGPAGQDGLPGAEGAHGSTGATGPIGAVGATGANGIAGATGPAGLTGAQGAKGEKGERGLPGPPGPSSSSSNNHDAESVGLVTSSSLSSRFSWMLMGWCLVLSLVIVIITIAFACIIHKMRKEKLTPDVEAKVSPPNLDWKDKSRRKSLKSWINPDLSWSGYNDKDSVTASDVNLHNGSDISSDNMQDELNTAYQPDTEENWMGTLKSTTETCYSNETLNIHK